MYNGILRALSLPDESKILVLVIILPLKSFQGVFMLEQQGPGLKTRFTRKKRHFITYAIWYVSDRFYFLYKKKLKIL